MRASGTPVRVRAPVRALRANDGANGCGPPDPLCSGSVLLFPRRSDADQPRCVVPCHSSTTVRRDMELSLYDLWNPHNLRIAEHVELIATPARKLRHHRALVPRLDPGPSICTD